jgi:hypothetical protein
MLIVLAATAFGSDCERRLSTAELDGMLAEARRSLEKLDTETFVETTDALDLAIPCLGEPLTGHLAAEIHRTKGIRAVSERDPQAPWVFAAARAIEPAYKFPSTLIPDNHPVRLAYAQVDLSKGQVAALLPAAEGTITLDGRQNAWRPMDWPTVAQYLGADGAVLWTTYLRPGMQMPPYPEQTETPEMAVNPLLIASTEPTIAKRGNPKVPFAIATISSAVLTGVLLAAAGVSEQEFNDPNTPDSDLDALRLRANAFTVASGLTGAASVAFGIGFVVAK